MPFRFWTKHNDYAQLKSRVHRLEDERKGTATKIYVVNYWKKMMTANDLIRRLQALEHKQRDTDSALAELARDITIVERQLNKLIPFDETSDNESERATMLSESSTRKSKTKSAGPNAIPPNLSPLELPTTFTRRKGNGTKTVALETGGLRLCQAGKKPQVHTPRSEVRSLRAKRSDARFSKVAYYELP